MQVFLVYKNADMTEGRGPMVLDSIWLHQQDAENYANSRSGVMGIRGNQFHQRILDWILENDPEKHGTLPTTCRGWFCKMCFPHGGDWQVRPTEVMERYVIT